MGKFVRESELRDLSRMQNFNDYKKDPSGLGKFALGNKKSCQILNFQDMIQTDRPIINQMHEKEMLCYQQMYTCPFPGSREISKSM